MRIIKIGIIWSFLGLGRQQALSTHSHTEAHSNFKVKRQWALSTPSHQPSCICKLSTNEALQWKSSHFATWNLSVVKMKEMLIRSLFGFVLQTWMRFFLFNIVVEQWSYNTEVVFYLIALHIQSFEVSSYKYLWDSTNKAFDFHPRQNKQFYSLVWMDAELCFMQWKPKKQNSHPAASHSVEIQKENKNKLQFKMYCLFSSVLICNSMSNVGNQLAALWSGGLQKRNFENTWINT